MTDTNNAPETARPSHREESMAVVKNYTLGALVPALIPIPLVDLAALIGIQTKMAHSLTQIYEIEFSEQMTRAAITSLVTSVLPVAITPVLASLVKFIPGLGQISGVASMLVLAGAATYALGMVLVRHFEGGGTLADFDAQAAKEYFKEEFEKGKLVVLELKAEIDKKTGSKESPSATDPSA